MRIGRKLCLTEYCLIKKMFSLLFLLGLFLVRADNDELEYDATMPPYAFISLGDWGGAAIGGQVKTNVYDVAAQLAATATAISARYMLNVGDNFYWCGIQ